MPSLGVHLASDQVTWRLGLDGVLVLDVESGGAAYKAGIKPTTRSKRGIELGDIITHINGREIESSRELLKTILGFKVGEAVKVGLIRDGKKKIVTAKLQGR